MKTKKLLMPVLGVSAITAATVTPLMSLTSCGATIWNVLNMWYDSNGDLYLGGIKDGATERNVRSVFGDTLTIPKEVDYITPYAFVNKETMETTIPSFIKHFKFEDGYECKEIPDYAFFGAPFESVEIECKRCDGVSGIVQPFGREGGDWGLRSLGFASFFQTKQLKRVKICATIKSIGTGEMGDLWGQYIFGYSTKPIEVTTEADITSDIEVIDWSDVCLNTTCVDDELPTSFNLYQMFSNVFHQNTTETEKQWKKQFIVRTYNGSDGLDENGDRADLVAYLNQFRAWFGLQPATDYTEDFFHIDTINAGFTGNTWKFDAMYMPTKTYSTYKINNKDVIGLSTTYPAQKYFTSSGINTWGDDFQRHKYEIDMANWKGSFGDQWKMYIVDNNTAKEFKDISVVIALDGQELVKDVDYKYDLDNSILLMKKLSRDSKLTIKFWVSSNCSSSPRFVFTAA